MNRPRSGAWVSMACNRLRVPARGCLDDLLTRHPIEGQEGAVWMMASTPCRPALMLVGSRRSIVITSSPSSAPGRFFRNVARPFHPFSHSNTMASVERLPCDMASDVTRRSVIRMTM